MAFPDSGSVLDKFQSEPNNCRAPEQNQCKQPTPAIVGCNTVWVGWSERPVAILFISLDTCSDSIAKLFRACFLWGIVANRSAMDRAQINTNDRKLPCGGAKGLLGRGTESLPKVTCAWANKVCARATPCCASATSLLLLCLQRPFAPSPRHFGPDQLILTSVPGGLVSKGIAQLSRDMLQNWVLHRCACVKLSTKGGYRTILGGVLTSLKKHRKCGVSQR